MNTEKTKEVMNWLILLTSAGFGGSGMIMGMLFIYGYSDLPAADIIGEEQELLAGSIALMFGGWVLSQAAAELEKIRTSGKS